MIVYKDVISGDEVLSDAFSLIDVIPVQVSRLRLFDSYNAASAIATVVCQSKKL